MVAAHLLSGNSSWGVKMNDTSDNINYRRKGFSLSCFATATSVMFFIWFRVGMFKPVSEGIFPYVIVFVLILIVAWVSIKLSKVLIKS